MMLHAKLDTVVKSPVSLVHQDGIVLVRALASTFLMSNEKLTAA